MRQVFRSSSLGNVFLLDFSQANALTSAASYEVNTGWGRRSEVEL